MILVKPSYEILYMTEGVKLIERAGRTCYKSEDKATADSADKFVRMLIKSGHHSVIEHSMLTVKFVVDRGVSHELVRHRLMAVSQESTRYCDYAKNELTFVIPPFFEMYGEDWYDWYNICLSAEATYLRMRARGVKPGEARSILPNSLKTELVCSANFREWIHILAVRTDSRAHTQMRQVMRPLLKELRERVPSVFDRVGIIDGQDECGDSS